MKDTKTSKTQQQDYPVITSERVVRSAKLKPQEKALYNILLSYGENVFPGHKRIAIEMGYSENSISTVKKWLDRLRGKGLIRDWKKKGFGGTNRYDLYRFIERKNANVNQPRTRQNDKVNLSHTRQNDSIKEPQMSPSISLIRGSQSASNKAMSINQSSNNQISNDHQELILQIRELLPQLNDEFLIRVIEKYQNKDLLHAAHSIKQVIENGQRISNLKSYFSKTVENEREVVPEMEFKSAAEIPSILESNKEFKARRKAEVRGYDENSQRKCDVCGKTGISEEIVDYSKIFLDNWREIFSNVYLSNRLKDHPAEFGNLKVKLSGQNEISLCLKCINLLSP